MGKRQFTGDLSPLPDNLRCRRSDGRQWRCPKPVKSGLSFCEYHYLQIHRNQNNHKNTNVEASTSATEPERRLLSTDPTLEKNKQRRLRKDQPVDDRVIEGESFDLKVDKNLSSPLHHWHHQPDRREWESSQSAITLFNSSDRSHLRYEQPDKEDNKVIDSKSMSRPRIVVNLMPSEKGKRRTRRETRVKKFKAELDEDECDRKATVPAELKSFPIPDTLRCRRSDGRMWRCAQPSKPGFSFCEHHQMRYKRAYGKIAKPERRSDIVVYPRQCFKRRGPRVRGKLHSEDIIKLEQNELVIAAELYHDDLLCHQEDDSKNKIEEREGEVQSVGDQQCYEEDINRDQEEASRSSCLPHSEDLQPSMKDLSSPDHFRCRRSDGRKWRCPQLAMPSVGFCEYHHLQLRQNQGNRKNKKSSASKRKLRRLMPKKGLSESCTKATQKVKNGEGMETSNQEVTRNLPNGVMAISPAPMRGLDCPSPGLNSKIGSNDGLLLGRRFRSKNADLVPLGKKAQVVPCA